MSRGVKIGQKVWFSRFRQSWWDVEETGTWEFVVNGQQVMFGDANTVNLSGSTVVGGTGNISGGGALDAIYKTPADLLTKTPPATAKRIWVQGFAEAFDGGGAYFVRKTVAPVTTPPTNIFTFLKDATGQVWLNDDARIDSRSMGIFPTLKQLFGGVMTAGSNRLTLAGAGFSAATDIGKWIQVDGAGPLVKTPLPTSPNMQDQLTGKIITVVDANTVDIVSLTTGLPLNAAQTITGAQGRQVTWAKDYTVQMQQLQRSCAFNTPIRVAHYSAGDYLSTDSLCELNGYSNFHMTGDGVRTRIVHGTMTSVPNNSTMFYFVGALVKRTTLTKPVLSGTDIIEVASTANIRTEMWMSLRDNSHPLDSSAYSPGSSLNLGYGFYGENVRIRAILPPLAPSTFPRLQLHSVLRYSYAGIVASGKTTDLQQITPQQNIRIHDICLDSCKPFAGQGATIGLVRGVKCEFRNIRMPHTHSNGFAGSYWIDTIIDSVMVDYTGGVDGTQQDGDHDQVKSYTIDIGQGCQGVLVSNCIARNTRHFCTGSAGGDIAPYDVHFSDCFVSEARVAYDSHPGCDGWTWDHCQCVGGIWQDEVFGHGAGFQVRGNNSTISNSRASGFSWGYQPAWFAGLRLLNCEADSCDVALSLLMAPNTEVRNFTARNSRTCGVWCRHQGTAPNILQDAGDIILDGIEIIGNPDRPGTIPYILIPTPCAFAFGIWTGAGGSIFTPQWYPGIRLTNWRCDEADIPFMGGDHEAIYGNVPDIAIADSPKRETHSSAAMSILTSGVMFITEIQLVRGRPIDRLGTLFASPGAGQSNCWMAILDRNQNMLVKSADRLTSTPGAGVITTFALPRVFRPVESGTHYLGICQVATTMGTQQGRTSTIASTAITPILAGTCNTGLTGPASWPTISTTSTTSLSVETRTAKQITVPNGLAFSRGMRVRIARTSAPTTWIDGYVTNYYQSPTSPVTLWVTPTHTNGAVGPFTDWTITADAKAATATANANRPYVVACGPVPPLALMREPEDVGDLRRAAERDGEGDGQELLVRNLQDRPPTVRRRNRRDDDPQRELHPRGDRKRNTRRPARTELLVE